VAGFISRRSDPGSYHDLCDSDSALALIPWAWEAFHDATGTNRHSVGIAAAWQAHQLPRLMRDHPRWVSAVIRNMAGRAAAYDRWLRSERGIAIPARRITASEARAGRPGFCTHAQLDPERRTDPGFGTHPALFEEFLDEYRKLTGATASRPTPEPEEVDPMAGITLEAIGLKVIETVRWCTGKDDETRRNLAGLLPSLEAIGLKVVQTVRWCTGEDPETREHVKALVREVLDERDSG
jgi:hypothetical protein